MSLDKIGQYIRELEAIKCYDQVKAEGEILVARTKYLKQEVSRLEGKIEERKAAKEKLEGELKSKVNELENLGSKFKVLELEASELREMSKLVGEERLTLPQLRELVAKVKSEEIKAGAEKLFTKYRSKWETKEKPKELVEKASRLLASIIETLKGPEPHYFAADVIDLGLPDKVEEAISSEAKTRLDEEFHRRVGGESNRKASEKLNQLEGIEWPKWYAANVEPKIAQLEASIRVNTLNLLKGPWTITCVKCGQSFETQLAVEGLENLIRSGYTDIECQNPNCTDSFLRSTWRHKVRTSIKDLIEARIRSTSMK